MMKEQIIEKSVVNTSANWYRIILLSLFLSGCSTDPSVKEEVVSLDIAPKTPNDVRYPEWGDAPAYLTQQSLSTPQKRNGAYQKNSSNSPTSELYHSLVTFLNRNGIEYEVVSGEHTILNLKQSIRFAVGSDKVPLSSQQWLASMSQFLEEHQEIDIIINGHADNSGAENFNDRLSTKRAEQVKAVLLKRNVMRNAIYTRGYGDSVPLCSNNTSTGRACNRRVELVFILPEA